MKRERTSSSQEVRVFDDVVVPRYRALFGRLITDELPHDARTILNLGCATGRLADRILDSLSSDNARVVAVDEDAGLIDLARRRGYVETGKRLFFKVEPFDALSFGDEVFDAAVANLLFERARNPTATLAELRRVLVPRGRVVLTTTLRDTWVEVLDMFREIASKEDDVELAKRVEAAADRDPRVETVVDWAQEAGFSEVRVREETFRLSFRSAGEAFLDPLVQSVAMPTWETIASGPRLLERAQRALDIYHGGAALSMTIHAAVLSARR